MTVIETAMIAAAGWAPISTPTVRVD